MALSASLSHVVLVITAAVLFYVALTDFKEFKIRNEFIVVLAGLFVVHALLSGRWVSAHWNLAFATLMFCVMLYFYTQNLMGGGDVKLAAALALWFSPASTVKFLVIMSLAGGLLTVIVMIAHRMKPGQIKNSDGETGGKPEIPYGVAIAVGALWILAQRFFNQFA